jgi:hypothetical protein
LRRPPQILNVSASVVESFLTMLGVCLAYCCYCGAEYRYQAHAQFKVFRDQVKARDDKLEVMTTGIKPMLDCIGFAPPEGITQLPGDPPPRTIVDRCQTAWSNFNEFTCSAAHGAVIHVLAQLQLHYPSVDLQWVVTGYTRGTDAGRLPG